MKFTITIKDPDGFSNSVKEAIQTEVAAIPGLDDDEREDLVESRTEKLWAELERFVEYQEVIRIEFDTDADAAIVVPLRPSNQSNQVSDITCPKCFSVAGAKCTENKVVPLHQERLPDISGYNRRRR